MIGSIAAGVSAASRLTAHDTASRITVYEKGAFYSCGTDGLPHYIGVTIDELKSAIRSKETELAAAGINACLMHEVRSINAAAHTVSVCDLSTGRVFEDHYDKLVVAVGSTNLIPQVPGSDKVGVHSVKSVEDVIFLKEFVRTPYVRDIVILGATWTGLELAKVFLKLGRNVRIIDGNSRILPEFDPDVSELIKKQLELEGVKFSLGETVRSFPGRTFVEQVQTNRNSYNCDLCIAADNAAPNTAIFAGTGVELSGNGAALVDDELSTNVAGIYAVGNCAVSRRGNLHTTSIRVGDTEIARTGISETAARQAGIRAASVTGSGNDRPGICPNPQKISIKLVYEQGSGRIIGAQAWGGKNVATRINAIAVAITAGMTAKQLASVDFCFSSAESTIWDPVQIVCGLVR